MNEVDKGTCRRFIRRPRRLILLFIVVLVGLVGVLVLVHRDGVERRLAALRAAGYPTSFAELAEYTKLPEGTANAADVYARAFAAFVPPADEANVPLLGKVDLPERGAPLPEAMRKAIAACLKANEECLSLLHEAGRIEDCRYDWVYADVLSLWKLPPAHMKALKHCSLLLQLHTIFHGPAADNDTIIAGIHDELRLGDSLRREPGMFSYLLQIATYAIALNGLERALSVTTFTDAQLTQLDEMLAASSARLDLCAALVTQRCFIIEEFQYKQRLGRPPLRNLLRTGGLLYWAPGIQARGLPDILGYLEKYVEAADLPLPERLARFRAINDEVDRLSALHVLAKIWMPFSTGSMLFELDPRIRVHFDLARTALAIERFRLPTDALPERLDELVPRYLPQVPIDPFDGQPIRYRRRPAGYLLYSVGADGQDNNGREEDEVKSGEPCDWCFIVVR